MKYPMVRGGVLAAALLTGLVAAAPKDMPPPCGETPTGREHQAGGPGRAAPFLRDIELSDAQQAQIKAISQQQARPDFKLMQAQRQAMLQLISAPTFDAAKAQSLINAQQQDMQRAMLARLEAEQKIFALLTPEQQAQVKKNMEKMPPERAHQHGHQPSAE